MIGPGESDFNRAQDTYLSPLDCGDEQEKCLECDGKGEFEMMYLDADDNKQFEQCTTCEGSGYVSVSRPITEAEYFDAYGIED